VYYLEFFLTGVTIMKINIYSLKYKIIGLSVAFVLCLLPMNIIYFSNLYEQQAVVEKIEREQVSRTEGLVGILYNITVEHAAVLGVLSPADGALDEERIYEEGSKMLDKIQVLDKELTEYVVIFKDSHPELYTGVVKNLEIYGQSFVSAVEMSTVDASFAAQHVATANASYSAFTNAVLSLVNVSTAKNREALSQLNSAAEDSIMLSIYVAIGILLVVVGLNALIIPRIIKPIERIQTVTERIAEGDLEVEITDRDRKDETGALARALQIFKENAVERLKLEEVQRHREEEDRQRREQEEEEKRQRAEKHQLENEEQERRTQEANRKAMLQLADQFEESVMELVGGVAASAQAMEKAARGMAATADKTSEQSNVVSSVAQQASSNAQMVASAAEQLSASVREITGQTTQSTAAVRDAVSTTDNASKDIAELADAAQRIGDVVKMIDDIAQQTNLLALNATIEAARAGEAGKGFSVVASEVKSLATETANATREISEQVKSMQAATNTAVNAIDHIKKVIVDIEASSGSIAASVEEQDASTQEIARNVSEVSTGTEEVTSIIQDVNAGATSTGSAASEVLGSAQELTQQFADLRTEVDNFLISVRQ
jgi:methyl-accepting chemotaxis protein